MFGRHPRLSIDAYLCLDNDNTEKSNSYDNYAKKLEKRLEFAYKIASREADNSAVRHKHRFDRKVRETSVRVGDRVLIRNVGLKGKQKLADKWARDPYIVVSQPNSEIPVFRVKKEYGQGKTKVLHRNMLLPIPYIPNFSDVEQSQSNKSVKPNPGIEQVHESDETPSPNLMVLCDSDSSSDSECLLTVIMHM